MAYPPVVPPANRVDQTPQFTNHPGDHNTISRALTDIVNVLGATPQGTAATLTARISFIENTLPLFQYGLHNGQTDGNAFATIKWPIPYAGIPPAGDHANDPNVGAVCIGARGPGDIITTAMGSFALGNFNAQQALIKVWDHNGVEVKGGYVVFHFMVWGPRYNGQTSAGVVP